MLNSFVVFQGKTELRVFTCKKRLALERKPGFIIFHEVNSVAKLCIKTTLTNFLTLFSIKNFICPTVVNNESSI